MIGLKEIEPGQTVLIDVKTLRDQQIPDERGSLIPQNLTEGQLKWTIRSEEYSETEPLKKFELVGRSEQIDLVNKTSSSYACQNCCQMWKDGFISSGGITEVEIGDQIQFVAYEEGTDCYGTYSPPYLINNDDVDWDSNHDDIATVSNLGLVTIVGVGEFEIDGDWSRPMTSNHGGYCPGPYLTGGSDGGPKGEKAPLVQNLLPDCSVCTTAWTPIRSDIDLVAKPKVTINVPSTAVDGSTANFSVTVTGGTPTAYQWSFTAPSGSGNNPQVNFATPTAANTTAPAHWFANPNRACPATSTDSTYKIKVTVSFSDRSPITKEKSFKVTVPWSTAGRVEATPSLTGFPDLRQNPGGTWFVSGIGNTSYVSNAVKTINVSNSSQFFSKTDSHEDVHLQQWSSGGLLGQYFDPTIFFNRIRNFTDTTRAGLVNQIVAETLLFYAAANTSAQAQCNQAEIDAYTVSDLLNPMFLYQRCGATVFPNC